MQPLSAAFLSLSHQREQGGEGPLGPPTPPSVNAWDPWPSFAFSGMLGETSLVALVRSCLAQGLLPACSCGSGDTPRLQIQGAHGP